MVRFRPTAPLSMERSLDPDHALIHACQQGGSASGDDPFEVLHERHKEFVHRICLRITGNASDALDAAQEAFLLAFRRIRSFRHQARFSRWLYRIAARASLEHLRKRRLPHTLSECAGQELASCPRPDPLESAARREQRARVRRTLRRLSPRLRKVLVLRYFEGLSYREIELRLALAGGSVKSRLHRAHGAPVWRTCFALETEKESADPAPTRPSTSSRVAVPWS